MTVNLREVLHSDWSEIKKLYTEIYNKIPQNGFETAFFQHTDLLGYCLILNNEIDQKMVGFFGCFTYNRNIDGKSYKFYNTHTWIVKKNYRKHAIKLLMPFLRLKDGILTNFTPNKDVYNILKGIKFKEINVPKFSYEASIFNYLSQSKTTSLLQNPKKLSKTELELVNHHLPYTGTKFYMFPDICNDAPLWLLTRITTINSNSIEPINKVSRFLFKKPLFTRTFKYEIIHFCNDYSLLEQNLKTVLKALLKQKVGGLICSKDLLNSTSVSKFKQENEVRLYKNPIDFPFRLDALYSEVFYLNGYNL